MRPNDSLSLNILWKGWLGEDREWIGPPRYVQVCGQLPLATTRLCLFREETPEFSGWTIVDFKTDREVAGLTDRYVAQVQLYSDAVAKATSTSVRGIVLVL